MGLQRRAEHIFFLDPVSSDLPPTSAEIATGVDLSDFISRIEPSFAGPEPLDPRYEWHEIIRLGGTAEWIRGRCRHLDVVAVESVAGEIVAHLCLTCDAQLPEGWRG